MPIDPSIALQTRGIELPNPINQFAQIQQIKAAQNQNALAGFAMQDRERAINDQRQFSNAFKDALDPNTGAVDRNKFQQSLIANASGHQVQAAQDMWNKQDESAAKIAETKSKTANQLHDTASHQYVMAGQLAGAWANNPAVTKQEIMAGIAAAEHSGVISPQIAKAKQDELSAIGEDAPSLNTWAKRTLMQVMAAKEQHDATKPVLGARNLGGVYQNISTDPITGTVTVNDTQTVTQSPDSVASNATQRANNAANIGIQRERLNYEKSQPKGQILQTDQGVMLVDPRGGTAQPVTSNGEPLQPKLRQLPAAVQKSISENNASLRKVETAIAELEKYPGAFGVSNYLGDTIRQRTDPQGVAPRAFVADIGSLIVHDRSGASVTAAETPRLKPFIPDVRDDPATIKVKLKRFRDEYKAIQDDYVSMYSREQGYKMPNAPTAGIKPTLGQIFGE